MTDARETAFSLARTYEQAGNTNGARALFAQAAKAGHAGALGALARNLLVREPRDVANGIAMLKGAADGGDAEAAELCAALAAQDSELADRWKIARDYLGRAAQLGSNSARRQAALLGDIEHRAAPPARIQFESPRILCADNFATPEICDWLIDAARPRLAAAEVYDPATGSGTRRAEMRSNSAVQFDITQFDVILVALRARIAALAGIQPEDFEPPMVLHYAPGQHFAPHFDFVDPAIPALADDVARNGQRIGTFLLYLNEGFDGGETDFPELAWRFKGGKGDGLLFWSVDTSGVLDPKTLHAGLPVTVGEKWVLSQWIRRKAR